jgi:hypothetical protein
MNLVAVSLIIARTTSLGVAHRDARGCAPGSAANANYLAHALRMEPARGEALHCAHAGADACVELVDSKVVEKAELGAHHVEDGKDGEICRVRDTRIGVDRRGAGGTVAAAEDVCTDDKKSISVEWLSGANEFFPPAFYRVGRSRGGV